MDEFWESKLGTAATLLLHRGEREAAGYLLEIRDARYGDQWNNEYEVIFEVDASVLDDFTDVIEKAIRDALNIFNVQEENGAISRICVVPSLVQGDWRSDVMGGVVGKPSSNGSVLRGLPIQREDNLPFVSGAELALYRALRRKQSQLPANQTITIIPNPSVRVPGHTWAIDFIVLYRGRVGMIEVDGPSHTGKRSSDRSRDRLLEDAGVGYVDRIDAADTDSPGVDAFVERFLERLGG